MQQYMTQSDYAREVGVSRQYINQLVREGKLKLVNRKVDVDQANKFFERGQVVQDAEAGQQDEANGAIVYMEERARKMKAERELKELELKKARGELIETELAIREGCSLVTSARNRLLAVPNGITHEVAATSDHAECFAIMSKAIREALDDLSGMGTPEFYENIQKSGQHLQSK